MIESVVFQNSDLIWLVVSVGLALWMLFLWKEQTKPLKKSFYLNAIIALISILSLAMLVLKPLKTSENKNETGVLLTAGFRQETLDSLKKELQVDKTLTYYKNLPIGKTLDSIGHLYVLGNGVATYDFWQFENRKVDFLKGSPLEGITHLRYPMENSIGAELIFRGKFRNANLKDHLVLQNDSGVGLDSILLEEKEEQGFEMATALKATGKFLYKLTRKDSTGHTISSEPIPFRVMARKNIKILIINSFPVFETKYLKNYLAEMGHEVVVKSRLTKARYKFEYFNTERKPIYGLNESNLMAFDLLIMDVSSFQNLNSNEKAALENSIKKEGLGLFFQAAPNLINLSSKKWGFAFKRDQKTKVILEDFPNEKLERIPFSFQDNSRLMKIHDNEEGSFTAYKRMQKGRVGATLFQNTYFLELDGRAAVYRKIWSTIVETLSKKDELVLDWELDEQFPLKDSPLHFNLRSTNLMPMVFAKEKSAVPLRQDIDMPNLWHGVIFPQKKGWNTLYLKDKEQAFDFYVFDSLEHRAAPARIKQDENQRYFANQSAANKKSKVKEVIEPFWFFLMALLGMGYLWLEPKMFSD